MTDPTVIAVLALGALAISGWPGTAAEAQRSERERFPSSSVCMARCVEMEIQCQALEKEFPTCSTVEICDQERRACDHKCRLTASLATHGCTRG